MHYHIILTELCNKKCKYCYEKSMKLEEFDNIDSFKLKFDKNIPDKSQIDLEKLDNFLKKGDVLIFYGGEPLLEIEKIKKIIDKIGNKVEYRMQTNGMLLDKLPIKYLNQIGKILVSIDGNKQRTDYNRGIETYDTVINNIEKIRKEGYCGEIVARMTITQPDLYEQVRHLAGLIDQKLFDSIHWQLDAGFYKSDFDLSLFKKFVEEYNKQIDKLIIWWISKLSQFKFYRLYPFIGIVNSVLNNTSEKMRCGAGHSGFAITTDGHISACPVTNGVKSFYVGSINNKAGDLKKMDIKGKCVKCSYLNLCGGRCLYQNYAQLWPEKGEELICKTIKHLIDKLKYETENNIKGLITKGMYEKSDFDYEKYFGPEIIP